MRKGNIIAGLICAALAVYVIVTCLGYPRAEAYGTGVPGPGLWPGIIAALLLICSVGLIVVTLMMKKDQFPELPMWTPGTNVYTFPWRSCLYTCWYYLHLDLSSRQ